MHKTNSLFNTFSTPPSIKIGLGRGFRGFWTFLGNKKNCHPEFISGSLKRGKFTNIFAFRHPERVKRPKDLKATEIPKQLCIQAHTSSLRCGGSLCKVRNDNLYVIASDTKGGARQSRSAFTLAEVLITLVIIGVIAALTLPTLIGKYQKHQTVVGLKKAYSEINNAVRMSVAENGDVSNWTWLNQDETFINKYFIPYFKIVNIMTKAEAKEKAGGTYYRISGQPETGLNIITGGTKVKVITLPSGTQVWLPYRNDMINMNNNRYSFYIDINGPKKPNTFGKDIFIINLWRDKGQVLFNAACDGDTVPQQRTINQLKNGGVKGSSGCYSYHCNKTNGFGMWCGALIQAEGWEIKDDYPW